MIAIFFFLMGNTFPPLRIRQAIESSIRYIAQWLMNWIGSAVQEIVCDPMHVLIKKGGVVTSAPGECFVGLRIINNNHVVRLQ
jgi:hypothetical protein